MTNRKGLFRPDNLRSLFQVGWTITFYFALWACALMCTGHLLWLGVIVACMIGITTVRIFNIQHDCTHHSYFTNKSANDYLGLLLSPFTLTPHFYWTKNHLRHHGTAGNLDRRGFGDIYTYTLREFNALPVHQKLSYVLYRNPFVFLFVGPIYHFGLKMRYPGIARRGSSERRSIYFVDTVIVLALAIILTSYPDSKHFFLLYIISFVVSGAIGLGLFYVQHQFEETYWQRSDLWRFADASIQGSSYLRMPRLIEWFLVYINLHHVHHLYPKTPNYWLRARAATLADASVPGEIDMLDAWRAFRLKLWDEDGGKMIGFPPLKRMLVG